MTSQRSSTHRGIATIALIMIVVLLGIGAIVFGVTKKQLPSAPPKQSVIKDKPISLNAIPIADQPKTEAILEITLHFNLKSQPILTIIGTRQLQGYAPRYLPRPEGYTLELLDSKSQSLSKQTFVIPSATEDLGALNHTIPQGQTIELNEGNFALTVPLMPYTTKLKIFDDQGAMIATKNL